MDLKPLKNKNGPEPQVVLPKCNTYPHRKKSRQSLNYSLIRIHSAGGATRNISRCTCRGLAQKLRFPNIGVNKLFIILRIYRGFYAPTSP